ncbi:MAG TPA: ATP-dependent DNA helicase RecQ, partial [Ktedonobacter sp.]|nr:ATP-dependent DNA helicase RecQ [Ktedonobacter sp.]
TLHDLSDKTHLSRSKLAEALSRLEEVGVVKTLVSGEVTEGEKVADLDEVAQEVIQEHESRR